VADGGALDASRSRTRPVSANFEKPEPATDFGKAAAAARADAGARWRQMLPSERTAAIYSRLRQIDAARAKAIKFRAGPRGRYRVAGDPLPGRGAVGARPT